MSLRPLLFMLVGAILLTGLFLLLRPLGQTPAPTATAPAGIPVETETSAASTVADAPAAVSNIVELVVQDGKLVSGPGTIRVSQGDEVTIRITADAAEEFHLHGYDRMVALEANQPAELKLLADRSGRFEYELEKSKLELGVLEVQPSE